MAASLLEKKLIDAPPSGFRILRTDYDCLANKVVAVKVEVDSGAAIPWVGWVTYKRYCWCRELWAANYLRTKTIDGVPMQTGPADRAVPA